MPKDEPHLTGTEASAGSKPHVTRYILLISLILIIVVFAVVVLAKQG